MNMSSAVLSHVAYLIPYRDKNGDTMMKVTCNYCTESLLDVEYCKLPDYDWVRLVVMHWKTVEHESVDLTTLELLWP